MPVIEKTEKEMQNEQAAKSRQRAEQLRFHLREAMAERKGTEAFLHYLRKDEAKKD